MAQGSKKAGRVKATIISETVPAENNIRKADTSTQVTSENAFNAGDWIEPPVRMIGYKQLVTESSILPQCIRAYKNNIAGFGIGVRYRVDDEETPEMAAEYERAEEIIAFFACSCV